MYLCTGLNRLYFMTKEEALRRFKAARQTKRDAVAALEEKMNCSQRQPES
jgi:hypothetical protein